MSIIAYCKDDLEPEDISCTPDGDPQEIPMLKNNLRVRSRGQSMYPLIKNGDILIIHPTSDNELRIGEIVYYRLPSGNFIVHRFISRNGSGSLVITGDGRRYPDNPVAGEQIFGKVIAIERDSKILILMGTMSKLIGQLTVFLTQFRLPLQIHLKQTLGRLHWFIGGRRKT